MADLLHVGCTNCSYRCQALQLTKENIASIKQENKETAQALMALAMVIVFCQRTRVLMPMELL